MTQTLRIICQEKDGSVQELNQEENKINARQIKKVNS